MLFHVPHIGFGHTSDTPAARAVGDWIHEYKDQQGNYLGLKCGRDLSYEGGPDYVDIEDEELALIFKLKFSSYIIPESSPLLVKRKVKKTPIKDGYMKVVRFLLRIK